jgi:DNA-binding response OmpR family regulator
VWLTVHALLAYDLDMADDQETQQSPYGEPSSRERPLIMIADDDPEIRRLLTAFFNEQDCDLLESSDGAEALEMIIVNKPNLVVLDVMMPELNGWQICKYVKQREEYDEVGIIMLTAIGPVNNELTSPLFGADDYMDKPFDFDELEFKVRKVLADKKKQPA